MQNTRAAEFQSKGRSVLGIMNWAKSTSRHVCMARGNRPFVRRLYIGGLGSSGWQPHQVSSLISSRSINSDCLSRACRLAPRRLLLQASIASCLSCHSLSLYSLPPSLPPSPPLSLSISLSLSLSLSLSRRWSSPFMLTRLCRNKTRRTMCSIFFTFTCSRFTPMVRSHPSIHDTGWLLQQERLSKPGGLSGRLTSSLKLNTSHWIRLNTVEPW